MSRRRTAITTERVAATAHDRLKWNHTREAKPGRARRAGLPAQLPHQETHQPETIGMTRNYYLLLGGYFISSVGNWLYQLALPLLVYEITHSPLSMAVTYGLAYLPYVFFLPVGGVIADRVDRRRLLIFGDATS